MLSALLQSPPKLLVWGDDAHSRRLTMRNATQEEIPETRLVRIKSACHIPMENNAEAVAGALAEFFVAGRR
jgi:pimeloyl-ACP methyl ester carboxylesterase